MGLDLILKQSNDPSLFAEGIARLGEEAVDGQVHTLCWISPKTPPSNTRVVLICEKDSNDIEFGCYDPATKQWEWLYEAGCDYWKDMCSEDILAWMELPIPPGGANDV